MHLNCPHCGVDIPAEDMHLENELAKCCGCDAVFSFAHAMDQDAARRRGAGPGRADRRRREQAVIGRPRRLEVREGGGVWEVRRRWFSPVAFFLVVFCLFWDGFLVAWYAIGATQFREMGGVGVIFFVFPILHVAAGVGLTWYTVAVFVNTTRVRLEQGSLSIRHGPLWVPGNRTIAGHEIEQLFCKERISRGKNGTSISYELLALLKDRQRVKLLTGYREIEEVLYLEQEIERRLKIRDRAMPGEAAY